MITEKKEVTLVKPVLSPLKKTICITLLVLGFVIPFYAEYRGWSFRTGVILGLPVSFLIMGGLFILLYRSIDISCPYCGFIGKVGIPVNPPLSLKCPRCKELILLRWQS